MSGTTTGPCPCDGERVTSDLANPPGLSSIAYRVGDFNSFRRALLRPLAGEQSLGPWEPVPGDLGLQVLEWWAYIADILTFYNERIANESYLNTAVLPESIQRTIGILGYRPRPGIGATGTLAALMTGITPLLLLDEVVAHLDPARRLSLFDELSKLGAQVWMTGADPAAFAGIGASGEVFGVDSGQITRRS